MKRFVYLALLILSVSSAFAQRRFQEANGIGIMAGANQTMLQTSNFDANPGIGWNAGLQLRGAIYNDFSMIYAINFFESNFTVDAQNVLLQNADANYKISGGQISLMLSYNIIQSHLSVEAGPMFQFNSKLSVDDSDKDYILKGTTFQADEIVEINPFNFNAAVGITAGVKQVRISVQYLFGVNNILNNLNDQDLGAHFNGHIRMITGNLIVFL